LNGPDEKASSSFLSGLGLFALTAAAAERRTKEIGIRAIFLCSGALAFAVAMLTIGVQARKAARMDPIKSLKCE
jgi:hypothetical protein